MRIKTRISLSYAAAVFATAVLCVPAAANELPEYQVEDLGTFGGTRSYAVDINESGQVVGDAKIANDSNFHGFLYSDGKLLDLGSLGATDSHATAINEAGQVTGYFHCTGAVRCDGGAFLFDDDEMTILGTLGGTHARAFAINDSAQITGQSGTAGDFQILPFRYDDGSMVNLNTLGGVFGFGLAINNAGQVAGLINRDSRTQHAFLYTNGEMVDLGTFGGRSSRANDINESGQVTGQAATADGATHVFLYSDGQLIDLGTLGGSFGHGLAINDAGQITGDAAPEGSSFSHAFIYDGDELIDLGTFGGSSSRGLDISESGEVTGLSLTGLTGPDREHGFVYRNSTMEDLNDLVIQSDLVITTGTAINERGQIAGTGLISGGEERAVLLTPILVLFADLLEDVTAAGPGKSLTASVATAIAQYEANDGEAACGALNALTLKIEAQAGKKIPMLKAEDLIEDAQAIQVALGCPVRMT